MTTAKNNQNEESAKELTKNQKVISSLVAGAAAGALAKTTIAPLDRTKINFQISKRPFSHLAAFGFIRDTVKNNGFLSLWRGNSATMARIIPPTPFRRTLAGSLAGVVSVSCTYPLDTARARMAVTHKELYSSLRAVFTKTWLEEGPMVLFRGYVPTVLGIIPYAGTTFYTYETLKRFHKDTTQKPSPSAVERLSFGAVAGLLGQSASYPLDIVRRRMQTEHETKQIYKTIYSTIVKIVREEGVIRGLYKGLSMNWIKGPIAVGISFTTFDYLHTFIKKIFLFGFE
uniref:Mitochondrial coenzyme A transporter SLC25A42 n=1 Tax=Strigamia maritima TaxID=126957 RepID=T1JK94_STRMM